MSKTDKRYERRILAAKHKARSELGDVEANWYASGYAQKMDLSLNSFNDRCPRIDYQLVSTAEFRSKFEAQYKPRLEQKYRNQRFKCGEDDKGCSVRIKMKYFVRYMLENQDDSPLYIFDANFGEHPKRKKLLDDYSICKYFYEDLFSLGGERSRPPYRWFVMGPARSGTSIHIDPLGTSAWNALVKGYKRWCLFPPNTPKQLVKPDLGTRDKNKHEAIYWFYHVYPLIKRSSWPAEYAPLEILQHPGETVFVPSGWWHIVLNLTNTVAVTQNFCSSINFPVVWHKTARGRPKFSQKWLKALQTRHPHLSRIAECMDLSKRLPDVPSSSSSSCSSSSSSSRSSSYCSTCGSRSPTPVKPEITKGPNFSSTERSPSQKRRR